LYLEKIKVQYNKIVLKIKKKGLKSPKKPRNNKVFGRSGGGKLSAQLTDEGENEGETPALENLPNFPKVNEYSVTSL